MVVIKGSSSAIVKSKFDKKANGKYKYVKLVMEI